MKKEKLIKLPFMPEALNINDFVSNVERRVRKNIRANHIIRAHENIILPNDSSINSLILKKLLLKLKKKLPFKVVKKEGKKISNSDLLDFDVNFMNTILFNKELHIEYAPLNVVHPEEIKIFAKFLKIEGVKSKENGKQLLKLEEKYPSLLFSIRKSYTELNNISISKS